MNRQMVIIVLLGLIFGLNGLLVYKFVELDSKLKKAGRLEKILSRPLETDKWKTQKIGDLEKATTNLETRVAGLEKNNEVRIKEIKELKQKVEQHDDSVIKILKKAMSEEKKTEEKTVEEKKPEPTQVPTQAPAATAVPEEKAIEESPAK